MREVTNFFGYLSFVSMVLKQIITKNLQNHKEVVIDLPPTGLIVFTGNNSNGKSVIVKVTKALISGTIRKPRKRANYVNRNSQFGEITYVRDDNTVLKLHLTREAATTYVSYQEPDKEPIVRYLADKNYTELVYRFGWHYDPSTDISLNIAEADTALLFYKTPNKANSSILETATSDIAANAVIDKFGTTLSELRTLRDNYNAQIRHYETTMRDLQVEDTEPLCQLKDLYEKVYRNLSAFYFPNIPEIKPVPKVHFANIYIPQIPEVKYPPLLDISCSIPDITPIWQELEELRNRRCPTCGRRFEDDAC